jgi:O-antigen/teichoic acid export membrane protein
MKNKIKIESYHLTTLGAWGARIVQAVAQIMMITLLTQILGVEEYTAYILITGLVGWYTLADLGIGISLQNTISELKAKNKDFKSHILLAQIILLFFLFVFCLIMFWVSDVIASHFLENLNIQENKNNAFFWAGVMMVGAAIFSASYKIWYAEGKGHWANIIPAIASIISLVAFYIIQQIAPKNNQLLWTLTAYLLPLAVLPMFFFARQLINGIHLLVWDMQVIRFLIKRGAHFFLFGLLATVVLQVDYIVISQSCSSQEIIAYNTLTRIFGLGFFVYNALLLALWPIIAEKIAREEWSDTIKIIKKYLPMGIVFMALFAVFLIFSMPHILPILIKNSHVAVTPSLILLFGFYYIIRVWTDTFAVVLQSMSDLRPFWVTVLPQALISIVAQIYLAKIYGIYGIILGLSLSFILTSVWYLPMRVKSHYTK